MNVAAAHRTSPIAALPPVRPVRAKDADGDYDGPPKTATTMATKTAAAVPANTTPVVVNGTFDAHA